MSKVKCDQAEIKQCATKRHVEYPDPKCQHSKLHEWEEGCVKDRCTQAGVIAGCFSIDTVGQPPKDIREAVKLAVRMIRQV